MTQENSVHFKPLLVDTTFIIEGRRIAVGSDFLSIHSPYFKALLKGDFAEICQEEFELNGVTYKEFLDMMKYLLDYTLKIKAEVVESLLNLADRYEIKSLIDRAESFLMQTNRFSISQKLLLADQYRLLKLQTKCVEFNPLSTDEQTLEKVMNSAEFENMSKEARNALLDACSNSAKVFVASGTFDNHYAVFKKFELAGWSENPTEAEPNTRKGKSCMKYEFLHEVAIVEEPSNGFIATGLLTVDENSFAYIALAGLHWKFKRHGREIYLAVNFDRPTSCEWNVAGFVEFSEFRRYSDGAEKLKDTRKYAFWFNNCDRVGQMKCRTSDRYDSFFKVTIHITSTSGIRQNPSFDFTFPSEFSNAVFIVEGMEIFVNKQILGTASHIFHKMLYQKDQIELKNVQYTEFIEFLHWIYPSSGKILSVPSLFNVMRVAQVFEMDIHIPMAHEYLAESFIDSNLNQSEKLIFLFQFNYGNKDGLIRHDKVSERELLTCRQVQKSPLLIKMCPKKKNELLKYANSLLSEPEKPKIFYRW